MNTLLTPTMIVRLALVLLNDAPRNHELTGTAHFSPTIKFVIPTEDLALPIGDGFDFLGFKSKHLRPAIEEWALTMPLHAKFESGAPITGGFYERFNGVGMVLFLSDAADGRAHLTLQVFPSKDH